MSAWTPFVKIWTVSNCESDANSLKFLALYHLLFALKSIWEGNLNLDGSYLITTVLFSVRPKKKKGKEKKRKIVSDAHISRHLIKQ